MFKLPCPGQERRTREERRHVVISHVVRVLHQGLTKDGLLADVGEWEVDPHPAGQGWREMDSEGEEMEREREASSDAESARVGGMTGRGGYLQRHEVHLKLPAFEIPPHKAVCGGDDQGGGKEGKEGSRANC